MATHIFSGVNTVPAEDYVRVIMITAVAVIVALLSERAAKKEQSSRENERKYRTLAENIPQRVFYKDVSSAYISCNDSFARDLKVLPDEIPGMTDYELYPTELAEKYRADDMRIMATGRLEEITELRAKNGKDVIVQTVKTPVKDKDGRTVGVLGIAWDITERKKAEEELARSEKRFRSIIENNADAILVVGRDGTTRFSNPAAESLFGRNTDELVGELFGSPTVAGKTTELDIVRPKGETAVAEMRVVETEWEGEAARLASLRDITERKRVEKVLREIEEQLMQAQKMEAIGRLAGGVAHDFNNLLTVIMGYSELLLQKSGDDPLKGYAEAISSAAEKAERLTSQLLAFSRKQAREPRILNLNDIVTEMGKILQRVISEDVGLALVPEPNLGHVRIDPGQIEQVIMNLAVNARDAMPDGGSLTIETANVELDAEYTNAHLDVQPGEYVMLAVTDTGHGMDEETRKLVFEPFFTTKEAGSGTGLGLSTVYGIVKQNGGNIWVYSEPGKGTTFKVYLPIVRGEIPAGRSSNMLPEAGSGSETILVVEDEEVVGELARQVLEQKGYKVLAARNGPEALIIYEQHNGPVHLLLTDVIMPKMSGKELAERLLALRSDLRVIYMSGYADAAIFQNGRVPESANYLQKPFTPDGLLRKVRSVLDEVN